MKYEVKYIGHRNHYIVAIKLIRQSFKLGLKEAKDFVDSIKNGGSNVLDFPKGGIRTGIHYSTSGNEVLLIYQVGDDKNHFDNKLFEI